MKRTFSATSVVVLVLFSIAAGGAMGRYVFPKQNPQPQASATATVEPQKTFPLLLDIGTMVQSNESNLKGEWEDKSPTVIDYALLPGMDGEPVLFYAVEADGEITLANSKFVVPDPIEFEIPSDQRISIPLDPDVRERWRQKNASVICGDRRITLAQMTHLRR
jgi:predicted small lipoprotein YifL